MDADCVYLWMYFALSVPVAVLGSLETSFEILGCSEARVLPCTCWCALSNQIFGEERRSLGSLGEQGMCVVGEVTDGVEEDVASAAVVELGAFFLASVAVDAEQVPFVAEQVAARVPCVAEQVAAREPFVAEQVARVPFVAEQVIVVAVEAEQVAQVAFAEQVAVVAAQALVELDAVLLAEDVELSAVLLAEDVELRAVLLAEDVAAVLELGVAEDVELGAVDVAVELGAVAAVLALAAVPRLLLVVLLEPCQQAVKRLCWSGASDPICVLELLN